MKTTLIDNGTNRIVLKAETPKEIIQLREFEGKLIKGMFHETTQILEESYPNCLVIQAIPESKAEEKQWMMFIMDQPIKVRTLIPINTTKDKILSLVAKILQDEIRIPVSDTEEEIEYDTEYCIFKNTEKDKRILGEFSIEAISTTTNW